MFRAGASVRPGKALAAALLVLSAALLPAAGKTLHTFKRITLTTEFWSEGAAAADFDRDGEMDVVSGPYWYAGPDFKQRHEIYPAAKTHTNKTDGGASEILPGWNPKGYSDNFFSFPHDLSGDGWPDVLVVGFPGKEAAWFENPGKKSGHWRRHAVFDAVDNESPQWADLTGDGRPELICNHNGYFGYAAPDWEKPEAPWVFHAISSKGQWRHFTHGLGIGDIDGDGRADLLEKDGWWQQPASPDGGAGWKKHDFLMATHSQGLRSRRRYP